MKLKEGTLLQGGRYRIDRVLGQGGFGITYLGEHVMLGNKLAIKEFFMKDLCNRDAETSGVSVGSDGSREIVERFRMKFIKEARSIYRLRHKHIIHVIDVFEENGTAYYVMEHVGGGSLADKVASGALPEADAVRYIRQVASALEYVHSMNVMHLDVKPANILLSEGDNAILIDFGLAKQYDNEGHQTSTTPVGISHGYAPLEQYRRGGVSTFSPATDIYSLGATLYKLVTGLTPPEASDVYDDGLPPMPETISVTVREAIEKAMQPRRKERPQSIAEFISLLNAGNGRNAAGVMVDVEGVSPNLVKSQTEVEERVNIQPVESDNVKLGEKTILKTDSKSAAVPRIIPNKDMKTQYSNENSQKTPKIVLIFLLLLLLGGIAIALFMYGGVERRNPVLIDSTRIKIPPVEENKVNQLVKAQDENPVRNIEVATEIVPNVDENAEQKKLEDLKRMQKECRENAIAAAKIALGSYVADYVHGFNYPVFFAPESELLGDRDKQVLSYMASYFKNHPINNSIEISCSGFAGLNCPMQYAQALISRRTETVAQYFDYVNDIELVNAGVSDRYEGDCNEMVLLECTGFISPVYIFFGKNSSKLSKKDLLLIEMFAKSAASNGINLCVRGFSGTKGGMEMSQKRAKTVQTALKKYGAAAELPNEYAFVADGLTPAISDDCVIISFY